MKEPLADCQPCLRNGVKALAVWNYAPSDGRGDVMFCDDHVPRGCSCNSSGYAGREELPPFHPEAEEKTDEQGRLLPCCEYWFDEDGFPLHFVDEAVKP